MAVIVSEFEVVEEAQGRASEPEPKEDSGGERPAAISRDELARALEHLARRALRVEAS